MVGLLDQQVFSCAVLALAGVAVGLLFDLLRAWRTVFQPGYWTAALGDLLFWGGTGAMLAIALYLGNWGEIRVYVLVSILAGAGVYWLCASRLIRLGLIFLLRFLVALVRLVLELVRRLIWRPAAVLGLLLYKGSLRLLGLLAKIAWWLFRPLLLPLYRRAEPSLRWVAPHAARIRSIFGRVRAWLSREPID